MDWSIPIAIALLVVFVRSANRSREARFRRMEHDQQDSMRLIHALQENIQDLRTYVYKINLKQREYETEKDKRDQAQQKSDDAG